MKKYSKVNKEMIALPGYTYYKGQNHFFKYIFIWLLLLQAKIVLPHLIFKTVFFCFFVFFFMGSFFPWNCSFYYFGDSVEFVYFPFFWYLSIYSTMLCIQFCVAKSKDTVCLWWLKGTSDTVSAQWLLKLPKSIYLLIMQIIEEV